MISLAYCALLTVAAGYAGWLWRVIDQDSTLGVVFPIARFFGCVVVILLSVFAFVYQGECNG
jgi:hypothetical protein